MTTTRSRSSSSAPARPERSSPTSWSSGSTAPEWTITIVDKDDIHDYQPGYLFIPFGINTPAQIRKTKRPYLPDDINIVMGEIDRVDAEAQKVELEGGRELDYDYLVIATGTTPRPDQTEGTLGPEWHKSVGEFYTFEGALALREQARTWTGGRLVVHITEMPIKCPVAPLEFTFLADAWLRQNGLRDATELVYVTPLDGAFTKPVASRELGDALSAARRDGRDRLHDRAHRPGAEGHRLLRRA